MDPVDTLIGLSEVSLALAGFAAIVRALLSAIVLAATIAVSALNFLIFLRHLEARASGTAFFWWSFVAVSCAVHLANVLGLLAPPSFGLFFLGLVILLSQAGLQFVFLVYSLLGRPAA